MAAPRIASRKPIRKPLARLAALAAECVVGEGDEAERDNREVEVCLGVARLLSPTLPVAAWRWVASHLPALWNAAATEPSPLSNEIAATATEAIEQASDDVNPLALFYEQFLQSHDKQRRKHRGVFYTPPALVRHVVRNVDRVLREEFCLADGLLDEATWRIAVDDGRVAALPEHVKATDPLVRILDPALGAGLFLTEIIWAARRSEPDLARWNEVAPRLLARLGGIEILPAAAAIALVRLAAALHATGYQFASNAKIDLRIGDALAAPIRPPWTVIVGNPPFSGISASKHDWVHALLRGRGPAGEPRANYFEFAGAPLAERKHWLQDDYVKFLRVAHEQIETAGLGIVALVTSHGYLDNITFRALREKLSATFPRISLVDLHGNAKRRERAPDGGRDENVFGIETGVAIGLFRKPPGEVQPSIERGDVWGTRSEKLAALASCDVGTLQAIISSTGHVPAAFHIQTKTADAEYEAGWPIDEAMPINSTAPVTARDAFVVADTIEELAERARDFCDPTIPDGVIRVRYFTRTRSRHYAAGDTRGWKLAEARQRMQALDWRELVQRVRYRPCDERVMLWAEWLIDWPRTEVTSHLLAGDNLALITRRQAPPNQPWNYVWITDKLALDGVIRSDNRGSESLFPLWLYVGQTRRANFAPELLATFSKLQTKECDPHTLLYYIYGLLHSRRYRQRYQQALADGFPRILVPRSSTLFERVAEVGRRLAMTHRMQGASPTIRYCGSVPTAVAAGYPRHTGRRLHLNATDYFDGVSQPCWQARVGTYQVCQKLLKQQRGKTLQAHDIARLGQAIATVRRTALLQNVVDRWALPDVDFASAFVADAALRR